jgi:hypothetical protein
MATTEQDEDEDDDLRYFFFPNVTLRYFHRHRKILVVLHVTLQPWSLLIKTHFRPGSFVPDPKQACVSSWTGLSESCWDTGF